MAKLGEGDERWIVRERDDGANVNNWHWTTKDVSGHTKESLSAAVREEDIFPADGPLAHCRIKSAETKGEASVNNRKGRTFLIYELEMKLKWDGELRDSDGNVVESGKGSIRLPDVSAESLDDLEVEFETKSRGTPLSEAMRTEGVKHVKRRVQQCIKQLQEEVTEGAKAAQPAPASKGAVTPAVNTPLPQPIRVDTAAARGPAPAPAVQPLRSAAAADSSDDESEEAEKPPAAVVEAVDAMKASPSTTKMLRLSNLGVCDVHLQYLIDALHHSQARAWPRPRGHRPPPRLRAATELPPTPTPPHPTPPHSHPTPTPRPRAQLGLDEIDLSFNRVTDAGVHVLLKALNSGAALELQKVYLGGNRTSPAAMALAQGMRSVRPDLSVIWKPQLASAKSMCAVGTVYVASPAATAGLATGDSVVAFGRVQHGSFKSVAESIVPIVKESVGKPIDVVVVRMDAQAQVQHIQLTLTPQNWKGAGLLGCILK